MEWLAVLFLFLFLCALLDAVLPRSRPSRLQRLLQPSIDRLSRRLRRRRIAAADPFDTLRVQTRLSHLAGEIRRIETTPRIYARAHRLKVAEAAYDDLLDEACRLAGVPSEADLERSEEKRWLEERELASRGWSW
jgi:hypothetical protein